MNLFLPLLILKKNIKNWNNTHERKVVISTEMFTIAEEHIFLIKADYAVKERKEDNK